MATIDRPLALSGADTTRAGVWMLLLATTLLLVTVEQGQLTGGPPLLHELFHDARHLLGVPCH